MWNRNPRDGRRNSVLPAALMDGILHGLKVVLSFALASVLLAGGSLFPLLWDERDSESALAVSSELCEPIYHIESGSNELALLVRTRGDLVVRDQNTGELLKQLPKQQANPASAAWVPRSRQVLIGFADGRLMLWEPERSSEWYFPRRIHRQSIRAVAITNEGTTAVTGSLNRICVWDLTTRKLIAQSPIADGNLTQIQLSPDDAQLLVGCDDGRIKILRLRDLRVVKQFRPETRCISHLKLLPFRNQILVGNLDGTAFLMDRSTGEISRRLNLARINLLDLKISPDGLFVACTDLTNGIHVYSLDTWERIATFKGHSKPASSLRFSESEPVLYSGSHDGTVRSWDLNSFTELGGYRASVPMNEDY